MYIFLEELEKYEKVQIAPKGPSSKENIPVSHKPELPTKVKIISLKKPVKVYSPSTYKSSSSVEEGQNSLLVAENEGLKAKIQILEEKVALLEHQAEEAKIKLRNTVIVLNI